MDTNDLTDLLCEELAEYERLLPDRRNLPLLRAIVLAEVIRGRNPLSVACEAADELGCDPKYVFPFFVSIGGVRAHEAD